MGKLANIPEAQSNATRGNQPAAESFTRLAAPESFLSVKAIETEPALKEVNELLQQVYGQRVFDPIDLPSLAYSERVVLGARDRNGKLVGALIACGWQNRNNDVDLYIEHLALSPDQDTDLAGGRLVDRLREIQKSRTHYQPTIYAEFDPLRPEMARLFMKKAPGLLVDLITDAARGEADLNPAAPQHDLSACRFRVALYPEVDLKLLNRCAADARETYTPSAAEAWDDFGEDCAPAEVWYAQGHISIDRRPYTFAGMEKVYLPRHFQRLAGSSDPEDRAGAAQLEAEFLSQVFKLQMRGYRPVRFETEAGTDKSCYVFVPLEDYGPVLAKIPDERFQEPAEAYASSLRNFHDFVTLTPEERRRHLEEIRKQPGRADQELGVFLGGNGAAAAPEEYSSSWWNQLQLKHQRSLSAKERPVIEIMDRQPSQPRVHKFEVKLATTPEEISAAFAVIETVWKLPPEQRQKLPPEKVFSRYRVLMAKGPDKKVAGALLSVWGARSTPQLYLDRIAVLKEHNKLGIATRLLSALGAEAASCPVPGVALAWKFDALKPDLGHFYMEKFPAVCTGYIQHAYRDASSPNYFGLPTHRFTAQWLPGLTADSLARFVHREKELQGPLPALQIPENYIRLAESQNAVERLSAQLMQANFFLEALDLQAKGFMPVRFSRNENGSGQYQCVKAERFAAWSRAEHARVKELSDRFRCSERGSA